MDTTNVRSLYLDVTSAPTWVNEPVQCLNNACFDAVLSQGHLHRLVLEVLQQEGKREKGRGGEGVQNTCNASDHPSPNTHAPPTYCLVLWQIHQVLKVNKEKLLKNSIYRGRMGRGCGEEGEGMWRGWAEKGRVGVGFTAHSTELIPSLYLALS